MDKLLINILVHDESYLISNIMYFLTSFWHLYCSFCTFDEILRCIYLVHCDGFKFQKKKKKIIKRLNLEYEINAKV